MAFIKFVSKKDDEIFFINSDHILSIGKATPNGSTLWLRNDIGIFPYNEFTIEESPESIANRINSILSDDILHQ